jgi:hypothetical protein
MTVRMMLKTHPRRSQPDSFFILDQGCDTAAHLKQDCGKFGCEGVLELIGAD